MSTHITPDHLFGLELLHAVSTLDPEAAPLVAALVRARCIVVPNPEAMLEALDARTGAGSAAGSEAACAAMVGGWLASQGTARRAPGDGSPWQPLADLGLIAQGQAALGFALRVVHASMDRAASDDTGPLLH